MEVFAMLRLATLLALITAILTSSAYAQINTKRYIKMASVNCEDAQTKADMVEIWKKMTNKGGGKATSNEGQLKVISSKTRGKTNNKLLCDVVIKTRYGRRKGLFSLTVFSNGRWTVSFDDRY